MKIVTPIMTKRVLTCFIAFIIAVPLLSVPTTAYASNFKDIHGHWAESYINKAVYAGFVKGYPDGNFRPDKAVTRAEFTSMVNKALGNNGTENVTFSDVPYNQWYYKDVAKGISAAFVGGYNDNTFRPNSPVTREEAAVMVSRFVPTYNHSKSTSSFKDKYAISSWANDAVKKIYSKGYMGAYKNDGKYHPKDPLTRAQTAKILCSILDKEHIVTSSTTVKSRGSTLSNRIYSNNVTMHSDLGSGDAELDNCTVLGTLYVYGGGEDTITVSNSRVANAYIEKKSSSVRVLAKGETVINKATTGNDAILETSNLSGGLYGMGFNHVDIKSSADTVLKGKFSTVNITGSSAEIEAESCSINTFDVSSYGRNSEINLDSRSSIGTANVNSKASFRGSGSINTMNVNSSDVSYETKPRYIKVKAGISSPNDDENSDLDIKVSPKHKAKNVDVDTTITLEFDTAVTKRNGSRIYDSDIDDIIELREDSSNGHKVSFSGRISSNKREITLTPDSDLDDETKYYVIIPRNEFYDTRNNGNDSQTTYFTTDDDYDSDLDIEVSPKHKAKNVDVDTTITLEFDTAVTKRNGSRIYDSDIDDIIELREDSSNGHKVSFSGRISSNKREITLTPDSDLDDETKYYVIIPRNEFYDTRNNGNDSQTTYFTTDDDDDNDDITFYPKNKATDVSTSVDPTIYFPESIEPYRGGTLTKTYIEDNIILRENNSSGTKISFNAEIKSSKKITIDPDRTLKEGQRYYLEIRDRKFRTKSREERINSKSVTWTTRSGSSSSTVSFDPSNNATNVKLNKDIVLNFSSKIYTSSKLEPSKSYLKSYISLRDTKSNKPVAYNIDTFNNYSSGAKVVLNPSDNLIPGHQYKVELSSSRLINNFGVYLSSSSSTFTVEGSIDTVALNNALSSATSAKSGVKVSIDGTDVFEDTDWVTKSEMTAFDLAISTANTAKVTVASKEQADKAAKALTDAITAFKNNKKSGSKIRISLSALEKSIDDAKAIKTGIQISTDGFDISPSSKWVIQKDIDTLNGAISTAEKALKSITTFEQVLSETETLNNAKNHFESKITFGKKADKSTLETAIREATKKIDGVRIQTSADEVPSGDKWVTSDVYKAFSKVITEATDLYEKRDALQNKIDEMVDKLEKATDAFELQDGTKQS